MGLPRSRKSALKLGRTYYKTGEPCSRGHIAPRFTKTRRCVECDKLNAMNRRESIKLRTPRWADLDKIAEIYKVSEAMGEMFAVDHFIPLNSDIVSGLHCPENLVIIDSKDNMKKGNKFSPIEIRGGYEKSGE